VPTTQTLETVTTEVKETLKKVPLWPWLLGAAVIIALCFAWFMLPVGDWLQQFSEWVRSLGVLGVVAIALGYMIGTVLLVPGSAMTIAAGVAYGWWAFPLVLAAATVGATAAFLVSRHFVQHKVHEAIEGKRTFRAAAEAVDEEGWKVLLLLRLSPVVPFNAQNYVYGATSVPLFSYVWATAVGIIPGTALDVYIGSLGSADNQGGGAAGWIVAGVGLIATVVAGVLVGRKARAKLREHGGEGGSDRTEAPTKRAA
jgi:uncharacterized membrane protein YdjX (TVP38/TMEM64 family)